VIEIKPLPYRDKEPKKYKHGTNYYLYQLKLSSRQRLLKALGKVNFYEIKA
jgi:hypothetical protein